MENPVITLTTDFGYKDPFVGIMKGIILKINPAAKVFNITHGISPQNIFEASFVLEISHDAFPHDTIHVAIVDPGVGSSRRPIIAVTENYYFIGPDNGIFSRIFAMAERLTVIHITAAHYFLKKDGSTFQGKDIFAPIAGSLSKGVEISNFGDPITDFKTLPIPSPQLTGKNVVDGEVIYIDRFGNTMTNIHTEKIREMTGNNDATPIKVLIKDKEILFKNYYAQVKDTGLYALTNSFGYLELFVRNGNAARTFGIKVGEKVGVILP
jgi:S-adenosylmethionine hydrolase